VFGNYLIGLREGLEAALVVSILVAYLVRVGRRDRLAPVWAGVAAAIALSAGCGALLTYTSTSLLRSFEAQEAFGGALSIVAVAFVTWMIFWMRRTARSIKAELTGQLESALAVGVLGVAVLAFLAVGREGLETALFFWSAVQAAGSTAVPVTGFSLGILTAVVLAWMLYRRTLTLNLGRFFTWTGAGLVVVAAGVLAYGFHDLQEAGWLPGLNTLAFDVSRQVPPGSWYGILLKGVLNFSPRTTVLEAVVYLAYLVPVLALFLRPSRPRRIAQVAAALLALALAGCGSGEPSSPSAGGGGGKIAVRAGETACEVSRSSLDAGTHTFAVTNVGAQVTEFYVYAPGDRVMGEVENIGPSMTRELRVELPAGSYQTACKPGQVGQGIRAPLTVSGTRPALSDDAS
jgi:high-affinity iron transporter